MASEAQLLQDFMVGLERRNPGQPEFHQAVAEVAASILPYMQDKPVYNEMRVLERLTEPDHVHIFRVCWEDDKGGIRVNRGYRVQCNNAIGPYKGGLRFHPTVTLSVLKFLAFEQTFKNSLTGLPMGGGKGGADFNPRGRSNSEVMRFCQSYMTELFRYIGADLDIPAGDIGVGAREIGYLFGQYKRLTREFKGVLTGKGMAFGGSLIRTEATGYGAVYFMEDMLSHIGESIEGRRCVVSGAGNVALYAAEKLIQLGATVLTVSDSAGYIYEAEGISAERLAWLRELKFVRRGSLQDYAKEFGCDYFAGETPWSVACDLVFPCATQNELNQADARLLLANGCVGVSEGANMPCELAAVKAFQQAGIVYGPSKAANAGGVAVSGLEMSQNSGRISWQEEDIQQKLRDIMRNIHQQCVAYGGSSQGVDYLKGANIAGFVKVADAMLAYGVV
jgi:glutamate dehydrogenase (NADP+)